MEDIALCGASEVAKCLVAPIGRHCGYVMSSDRYVSQLNDEVKNLGYTRDEVQHSIDEARNNMKPIKPRVERWVNEVETVANEARDVLDYDGRANKTCFYGWLPNPKARYHLGKKASRTVKDIQALIAGGQFEKVDFENPPPGLVGAALDVNSLAGDEGDFITDSRASIFQGIMKALNDEKVKVVGVYGPGGVGKTTLLEIVEKKLRKEGRPFHMIVKAKVSQIPVLKNIQDEIADALKLGLKDMQSESGRGNRLLERLQKDPSEKVLIILDDLWEELDLTAVGIPSGDTSGKCKLLLTSRFKHVLEQKMRADRTFLLEGLNNDEAFGLFEKMVGDRLKDEEELRPIAAGVVKKLAGLPLLIISVASTLKNSGVSAWKIALIKVDVKKMETIVKLSYDRLESEEAKSLFLLCGLIGGTIKVELLLGLGMGLGLFEGFDNKIEDSRDRLNVMLESLRSVCLLQDGCDDMENVTIHDLYSEVVVSTPFRGENSLMMNNNYGSRSKEKLEKCWAICLADFGRDRLDELMTCQFPDLKILMLSKKYKGDCNRMDFTYMKELRVLYFHFMRIASLPPSIGILGNLHSLYLDYCDVEDVTILGKLKALQILSFANSAISRLPKEIGELTNLRSLNLSNCYELKTIEPGVLEGLIKLEELRMKGSFDRWMGKDEIPSESCNARLAELKRLTKLTTLEISIPSPAILLKDGDLPFGNLIEFWINIGSFDDGKYPSLRTMKVKLEGCDNLLSKDWVQKTLQKTQYLYLDGLGEYKKNANELRIQGFTQLKHLHIQNNPSIKYIASSSSDLPTAFMILESLFLENLINLEKLCNGLVAPDGFGKLKAVRIQKCHQLENLWSLSKMQRLVHLEEMRICECDSLQAIITYDAGEGEVANDDLVELPNVRYLDLHKLPNITSFCTGAEGAPIQISLPRLESLEMDGLLGLEKILYSEPSLKYSNLKRLKIKQSKSMSSIPKDWTLKLLNLKSMEIKMSSLAKVVFDLEELKVTGDAGILSRLTTLKLFELPNLQCIWKQDAQLQEISRFRNLKKLYVYNTGLSFLFSVSVAKCLREITNIDVEDCPNMKAMIVDEEGRDEGTNDIIEFPLLKQLFIMHCPMEKFFSYPHGKKESVTTTSNSQDIYSDSFFDQRICLPRLENLFLVSIGSFKRIWHSGLPKSSVNKSANLTLKQDVQLQGISIFQNLKKLCVYKMGLSFLFPVFVAKCLREIRDIDVRGCPNMKAMIVDEEGRDEGTNYIIEFPLLKQLSIMHCPMEKFFSYPHGKKESITSTSNSQDTYSDSFFDQRISLPSLENLKLNSVGSFKSIWHSGLPTSYFDKLANLTLEQMGLSFLFPVSVAKCLGEIRHIIVEDCPNMEAVIVDEEGRDEGIDDIIEFPLLGRLSISRCPTEKFFSYPRGKKESITTISDSKDTYSYSFFDQKISLPRLENLTLNLGGSFKSIWHSGLPKSSFDKSASLTLEQDVQLQGISIFRNLKELSINNMGLSFLFPVSVAKCIKEIKHIEAKDCPNMKAVIVDEEGRDERIDDIIEFPLLERLSIRRCPMEKFFSYPCGKRESITTTKYSQDTYYDSFFDQKISLPSLKKLILHSVGSFKSIWHSELPKSSSNKLANLTSKEDLQLQGISVFQNLKRLSINNMGLSFLFPVSMANCLREIRKIEVEDCPNMKAVIVDEEGRGDGTDDIIEFPLLERLSISGCPMEKFFSYPHGTKESITTTSYSQDTYFDSFFDQKISLPRLENLTLNLGGSFKSVWHSGLSKSSFDNSTSLTLKQDVQLQGISIFRNLKELSINNMGLPFLFSVSVAKCIKEIEHIEVKDCPNMKAVIVDEEGRDDGIDDIIEFPLLERLFIRRCPMKKFFSYPCGKRESIIATSDSQDTYSDSFFDQKVTFPNLRKLYIEGIQCKELWNNQIPDDSFCKLESLNLKDCDNLQCIAPSHMWKRLQCCLETLKVKSCRLVEIIYQSDGMVAKNSNLRMLVLQDLDNLRHIWRYDGLPNIPFPSLRYVEAVRCSRLEMLFTTFTAKFLGQIKELKVGSCEDMELIAGHEECEVATSTTITFSKLTTLTLYNLPKFRSFLPEKYSEEFPSLNISSGREQDQGCQGEESEWESELISWESEYYVYSELESLEFDGESEGESYVL